MWLKYPENKPDKSALYLTRYYDVASQDNIKKYCHELLHSDYMAKNDLSWIKEFYSISIDDLPNNLKSGDVSPDYSQVETNSTLSDVAKKIRNDNAELDRQKTIKVWGLQQVGMVMPKTKEQEEREKEEIREKLMLKITKTQKEINKAIEAARENDILFVRQLKESKAPELTLREALEILEKLRGKFPGTQYCLDNYDTGYKLEIYDPILGRTHKAYLIEGIEQKILSLKKELEEQERPKSGEGWVITNKDGSQNLWMNESTLALCEGIKQKIKWEVVE
jgi:hypothetical protein